MNNASSRILLFLLLTATTSLNAADDPSKGDPAKPRILRVNSGDTVDVYLHGGRRRIHLSGIDAPEPGQQLAEDARAYLVKLLNEDQIRFDNEKGGELTAVTLLLKRMDLITIKKLELSDAPLADALDHLKIMARQLDPFGVGVAFTRHDRPTWRQEPQIDEDDADFDDDDDDVWGEDDDDDDDDDDFDDDDDDLGPTVTLSLSNVSLRKAVELVAACTGMRCIVTPTGVSFYRNDLPFEEAPAGFRVSIYSPKAGYSLSYMMIRNGYAWYRPGDNTDPETRQELARAEKLAKSEKLGIWQLRNRPMKPWYWRERYIGMHSPIKPESK